MKTWDELTHSLTTEDRVIVQLVITVSTHHNYAHMTMEEVYNFHLERTKEIMGCDKDTLKEMNRIGL